MNIKRLFKLSIFSFFIFLLFHFGHAHVLSWQSSILSYVYYLIIGIPILFFLLKWYFRKDSPATVQKGIIIGIILSIMCFISEYIMVRIGYAVVPSVLFITVQSILILLISGYAGFEFDDLYTENQ